MKGICILKSKDIQFEIDSDVYSDCYVYEIPNNISQDKDYLDLIKTLLDIRKSDVSDILFVVNNDLYFNMAYIMKDVFTEKQAKMFIIPEYKITWLNKGYLIEDLYVEVDYHKPRLPQYQVHLTDVCNLNCKGCGHYCNLIDTPNFLDINKYKCDIEKIKEKFWGCRWIYLLGGEPLLHKEAYKFIDVTRAIFPDADIRFTTNGLLLPDMPDEFWQSVRKNHIHIEISQYRKTRENWKSIQQAIIENDVQDSTLVQTHKGQFFKQRVLVPQNDFALSYEKCISQECHYLRDGKLYVCPSVALNEFFYNYYGMEMPYESEGIDLYNTDLDGWELLKELEQPNEACRYCTDKIEWFEWEVRSKQNVPMSDWIVEGEMHLCREKTI